MRVDAGGHSDFDRDEEQYPKPEPGRYHVVVTDAAELPPKAEGKSAQVQMDFRVLAGTHAGSVGRTLRAWFSASPNKHCQDMIARLAGMLGLVKPGECIDLSWQDAINRQLVIKVIDREWNGETRREVEFMGFWHLNHASVRDVPKNLEAMKLVPQPASAKVLPAGAPPQASAPPMNSDPYASL